METPSTPVAASAPASFDSAMDAAFDALPGDGGQDTLETDAPADTEPEVIDDPAPEPEVTDDPVDEPAPEPEVEEELDPADELKPDKVSPDGKLLQFHVNKAKKFFAARDFQQKIESIIPGATTEDIAQHYDRSVSTQQMLADFNSGDPKQVGQVADFWLGSKNPQAVEAFTVSVLDRLPHVAPQVYRQFEDHAAGTLTQRYYEEALRSGDEGLFLLAQNMDAHLRSGKYLTKDDFKARDPYAEEKARFDAERTAFNQERQRESQRALQQRADSITKDIDSTKQAEVLAGLASVEKELSSTPHWKHIQRDLLEKVEEALKANPTWRRQFEIQRQQAIQDQTGQAATDLKAMMKNFVSREVGRHRKGVISSITGGVLRANQTAHKAAEATAARREVAGSGAPVSRESHKQKLQKAVDYDSAFSVSFNRR